MALSFLLALFLSLSPRVRTGFYPYLMVLQMTPQQFLGQLDALRMGGARRHRAGIDSEQIASRRQHVAANTWLISRADSTEMLLPLAGW